MLLKNWKRRKFSQNVKIFYHDFWPLRFFQYRKSSKFVSGWKRLNASYYLIKSVGLKIKNSSFSNPSNNFFELDTNNAKGSLIWLWGYPINKKYSVRRWLRDPYTRWVGCFAHFGAKNSRDRITQTKNWDSNNPTYAAFIKTWWGKGATPCQWRHQTGGG